MNGQMSEDSSQGNINKSEPLSTNEDVSQAEVVVTSHECLSNDNQYTSEADSHQPVSAQDECAASYHHAQVITEKAVKRHSKHELTTAISDCSEEALSCDSGVAESSSEDMVTDKLFAACDPDGLGRVKVADLADYLRTIVDRELHVSRHTAFVIFDHTFVLAGF